MPAARNRRSSKEPLLSVQVYETLCEWIGQGVLGPGERLRDGKLAASLGVSRTPVREALNRLQDDGLVITEAGQWTRVAEISSDDIRNLFPIRQALEILALSLALPWLTDVDIATMRRENEKIARALAKEDTPAAMEADKALHAVYIDRCANRELIQLLQKLEPRIRRLYSYYFGNAKGSRRLSVLEHDDLIAALAERRGDDATGHLRRHLTNLTERLLGVAGHSV